MMHCPRCKKLHDILQYVRLEVIEEFSAETTPCYKCPSCKWIFAPADQMPQDLLRNLQGVIDNLTDRLAKGGSEIEHVG